VINDIQSNEKLLDRRQMTIDSDAIISGAWLEAARMYYVHNQVRNTRKLIERAKLVFSSIYSNVLGPYHVWFDTKGFDSSHYLSGAGAYLQTLMFGFAGIRTIEDFDRIMINNVFIENGLLIEPISVDNELVLPNGVNKLQFNNIYYREYRLSITLHRTNGVSIVCSYHNLVKTLSTIRLVRKFYTGFLETFLDCQENFITTISNDPSLESIILISTEQTNYNNTCIRGVRPEKQSHYYLQSLQKQFKCDDSGKIIPFMAVNDNYCDCQDGSDEPGTDACMNGRFYCPFHDNPRGISSGFVNDGICDCCDGSDEWLGLVSCKSTCFDEKRQEELERRRKREEKAISNSRTSYLVVFTLVVLHIFICGGIVIYLLCCGKEKDKIT
jgi:hypothetical protein